MFLVGLLTMLATITIMMIVRSFPSLGVWPVFGISWIAVFLTASALAIKERVVEKGISKVGKLVAAAFTVFPLAVAWPAFGQLWKSGAGLLLAWIALLSLMAIWVPLQGGEERT